MKKLVRTTLIFGMLILAAGLVFTGCQKEKDAEAEVVVVDVMAYGDNSNQEGVNWVRIVDAFEAANPGIDIQYELLYDEAYHQKVVARLTSGDVPDVAYMGADARWGAPWMEASQQWDHTPHLDAMYDPSLIPPHGPNGEIYEIPLGTSNITTVLFMNEKLVKELGFTAPKTYDDLKAMVPAAKKAGVDVITIDGADGWAWGSCVLSSFIARTSGDPQWVSKAVAGENKFTDKAFVDALTIIDMLVKDGIIPAKMVLTDYGTNVSNFSNGKALFMIQGQWAAGGIENPEVADNTILMAWPKLPFEKDATAGTVAAAPSVGYGVTLLNYFYSEAESTQRLRDGAIVAPILKNYQVPSDLPLIVKRKVELAQSAGTTDVIDSFLTGAPNDTLNEGMQKIVSGQATPAEIAAKVEELARK